MSPKPSAPYQISTGCEELDRVWQRHVHEILDGPGILIPDTEDDLAWHAFLGHSIDMQGFRAAEFAGIDPLTRQVDGFVPLRQRGIGIPQLAGLWKISAIRDHLLTGSNGTPLQTTLDVLRSEGRATGNSLADAFESFPWRKGHWTVRALLSNSAVLEEQGFSFRNWLRERCAGFGVTEFPPRDFRRPVESSGGWMTLEQALRIRLEGTFWMVGPALAAYMICDWQLWLWREGVTGVFDSFKLDSLHEKFIERYGRSVVPMTQTDFTDWWFSLYPELPPRLANECIWLGMESKTA